LRAVAFVWVIFASCFAFTQSQQRPEMPDQTSGTTAPQQNPCIHPAPLVSVEDYTGPMRRTVLFIMRKTEIKTVQRPQLSVDAVSIQKKLRMTCTTTGTNRDV